MMKYKATVSVVGCLLLLTSLFGSHAALATDAANAKTGGLSVFDPDDSDKKFWFKVNGLIRADATAFSGDTQDTRTIKTPLSTTFANGSYLRSLEVNFNGGLGKDLSYSLTASAEGRNVEINDAYIKYTGLAEKVHVMLGQVPMPYGFENSTSGKWISFLERSMPTAELSTTFRLGAMVTAWSDMFAGNLAITQPKFHTNNSLADQAIGKSDRLGGASRFIFSPVHTKDTVYHLSVGVRYQDEFESYQGKPVNNVRFRVRPEVSGRNTPYILNTGAFNAKSYVVYSTEAAWVSGPFTLQAEYGQANVRRNPLLGNPKFKGWYVQASYILTGESRAYNFPTGTLGRVVPKSPCGAWEVAVRRSYANLNSHEIHGGIGYNTGIALGWYAEDSVRIFGNYIRSNLHPRGEDKRVLNIFGLRCQIVF